MATLIVKTLRASGGDYSLFSSFFADMESQYPNLVAADVVIQLDCYNDWPAGLDSKFEISNNFITDETHKFIINVPESERHKGTPGTGFYVNYTSPTGMVFWLRNKHFDFIGLDVKADNANSIFANVGNTIVTDCIIKVGKIRLFDYGGFISNSIIYGVRPGAIVSNRGSVANCTIYLESNSGIDGQVFASNVKINNCYIHFESTGIDNMCGSNCTGNYNAVTNNIRNNVPGENNILLSDTSDLVDPINNDFHIKSNSILKTSGSSAGPIGAFYSLVGVSVDVNSIIAEQQESAQVNSIYSNVDINSIEAEQIENALNITLASTLSITCLFAEQQEKAPINSITTDINTYSIEAEQIENALNITLASEISIISLFSEQHEDGKVITLSPIITVKFLLDEQQLTLIKTTPKHQILKV